MNFPDWVVSLRLPRQRATTLKRSVSLTSLSTTQDSLIQWLNLVVSFKSRSLTTCISSSLEALDCACAGLNEWYSLLRRRRLFFFKAALGEQVKGRDFFHRTKKQTGTWYAGYYEVQLSSTDEPKTRASSEIATERTTMGRENWGEPVSVFL